MLAMELAPKVWGKVFFQNHIIKVLKHSVEDNKIPRDILLIGPSGIGKTSIAKIHAATLVCECLVKGNPCGICDNCKDIFEDKFQRAVKYVDGIQDSGIDTYRELLHNFVNHSTFYSDKKVLIIDEVHGLSKESLQAFLLPSESKKVNNTYFIFATTEGQKVKETLSSRCLEFRLKVPNELEISEYLVSILGTMKLRLNEQFLVDGVYEISSASNGNVRKALSFLEKVILSKDFSIENVRTNIDLDVDADITKILRNLLFKDGKKVIAIYDLEKLLITEDTTILFNKMFRQLIDIDRYLIKGISMNKPYYEKFLERNYKGCLQEKVCNLISDLIEVKQICGYYIEKNIFLYKIINFVKEI